MEIDQYENISKIGSIALPSVDFVTISTAGLPNRAIAVPVSPQLLLRLYRITMIGGDIVTVGGSHVALALYRLSYAKNERREALRTAKPRTITLVSSGSKNFTRVRDPTQVNLSFGREIQIHPENGLYYVVIQPENQNTTVLAPATGLGGGAYYTPNFPFGQFPNELYLNTDANNVPYVALRSARGVLHFGSLARD